MLAAVVNRNIGRAGLGRVSPSSRCTLGEAAGGAGRAIAQVHGVLPRIAIRERLGQGAARGKAARKWNHRCTQMHTDGAGPTRRPCSPGTAGWVWLRTSMPDSGLSVCIGVHLWFHCLACPACRFCAAPPAVVMRPASCSAAHRAVRFWCMGSCRHATGRPALDQPAPSACALCAGCFPPSPRRAELVHGLLAALRMALAGSLETPARPDRWTWGVAAEERRGGSDPPSRPASRGAIGSGCGGSDRATLQAGAARDGASKQESNADA